VAEESRALDRTLADAWADWEAAKSSKRSFDDDRIRWTALEAVLAPSTRLRALSARRVDDAFGKLQKERELSGATVNRYRALLRAVLRLQAARGYELGVDPAQLQSTRETARNRVFEETELRAFFGHLEDKRKRTAVGQSESVRRAWLEELEVATRLALYTGAREGELGELEWRHVDLKVGVAHFPETKSGGTREVPLSKQARTLLREWRLATGRPAKSERVFVTDPKSIGKRFAREARAAGLVDARFHDLRRTAASRMLESGLDARVVQSITGHRDLAVLLEVYHRASGKRRREAIDALGEAWGAL
jgi:integrase